MLRNDDGLKGVHSCTLMVELGKEQLGIFELHCEAGVDRICCWIKLGVRKKTQGYSKLLGLGQWRQHLLKGKRQQQKDRDLGQVPNLIFMHQICMQQCQEARSDWLRKCRRHQLPFGYTDRTVFTVRCFTVLLRCRIFQKLKARPSTIKKVTTHFIVILVLLRYSLYSGTLEPILLYL